MRVSPQVAPYCRRIEEYIGAAIPPLPKKWNYAPGWTRYGPDGNLKFKYTRDSL